MKWWADAASMKYCKDCKMLLKTRPSLGKAKERFWFETTGFHA
jgi:hypothetical protein